MCERTDPHDCALRVWNSNRCLHRASQQSERAAQYRHATQIQFSLRGAGAEIYNNS